ncbi:MAG: LuxR family transcriptional regulator [Zymomonas sp.]|nr:MAG: LuxR family transcriptional regulator [Zymomonas sp.]
MEKLSAVLGWTDRISSVVSEPDLFDILAEASDWIGARYFALLHHVDFAAAPSAPRLHNYPDGWESFYDQRRLGLSDPIHRASQRSAKGFFWSEVPRIIRIGPADSKMLVLGRQIGLGQGVTVPVNVPGEAHGSCSFVAEQGRALSLDALVLAQLIGVFAFDRLRLLRRCEHDARLARLSRRQLQCAMLAARGMSNGLIALELGLREDTVRDYLRDAFLRIGVRTRTELSIVLLRVGDLCFDDVPPLSWQQ